MPKTSKLLVIALGGNALTPHHFVSQSGGGDGFEEQVKNVENTSKLLAKVIKKGFKVVITHGNGPQVGNILLQQEYSKDQVSPMPLSICGAQSQGQIGTMLVEALNNELKLQNLAQNTVSLITHVLVDQKDPAFQNPTKPIGPIYTPNEIKKLKKQGQVFKEIMVGAFRRVVPSPLPLKILELKAIKGLLEKNLIPVACGGGGIPIIAGQGKLKLVDAVIDKDLASQALANEIKADALIILTDVKKAALNFGKPNQEWLNKLTLQEAKQYLKEGHFLKGSMGPKVTAAIKFIENGGKKAVIAHLKDLMPALKGKAGTTIIQNSKININKTSGKPSRRCRDGFPE